MTEPATPPVLVMDLDGTVIRSDTTHELLILCIRWAPLLFPVILVQLIFDRARAKRRLAEEFGKHLDAANLPYDEAALELVRTHREQGGSTWLVSGSDHILVERIALHLDCFDRHKGSDPGANLTSARKAQFLSEELPGGFLYAGNSRQDFAVWQKSGAGYTFRAPAEARYLVSETGQPVKLEEVVPPANGIKPLLKAMRLHQWAKNLLIFITPVLLLAHLEKIDVANLLAAFICFGFMASGTYLLNDLFDIQDDRKHSTKRLRQIAAGQLSVPAALAAFLVLTLGSLAWAFAISTGFGIMLLLYAFVTVVYSFRLKRLPIVDVFILAGLFTIRVWAGGIVVGAYTSVWFTMFIGLVFLSLALTKRYVEIQKSSSASISGRGYRTGDAPFVLAFGAATGTAAVLALAIYGLLAPNRLLDNAALILIMAAILAAWFMRIWLIAVRGELHDDPVLFAIKDKVSLASLGVIALCFLIESAKPIWTNWF